MGNLYLCGDTAMLSSTELTALPSGLGLSGAFETISYFDYDKAAFKRLFVLDGVQTVENYFRDFRLLKEVYIPASVESIEGNALSGSSPLTRYDVDPNNKKYRSIDGCIVSYDGTRVIRGRVDQNGEYVFPKGVKLFGDYAYCFTYDSSFEGLGKRLDVPEGVEELALFSFRGAAYLEEVSLPKSLKTFNCPFVKTPRLKRFSVHPDNPYFQYKDGNLLTKNGRFLACCLPNSDGDAVVASSVEAIDTLAFAWDKTYNLPESAAAKKNAVRNVVLPESMSKLPDHLFSYCCPDLKSLTLSKSIVEISTAAFSHMTANVVFKVDPANPVFADYEGSLVTKDRKKVIRGYARDGKAAIPKGAETVLRRAFAENSELVKLELDGVKALGEAGFAGCVNLRDATFGQGLVSIGDFCFDECRSLKKAIFPEGLESVGKGAFHDTVSCEAFDLPASLRFIGDRAFVNRSKNAAFSVAQDNQRFMSFDGSLLSKDGTILYYGSASEDMAIVPDGVKKIEDNAYVGFSELRQVKFPHGLEDIGNYSFERLPLERVELPDTLRRIGTSAFRGARVRELTLPENLKVVGITAFAFCRELERVVALGRLEDVQKHSFYGCVALRFANLGSAEHVHVSAFNGCPSLKAATA